MKDDVRFNRYKNKLISLREDETFCKKCNGKGIIKNKYKYRIPPFNKIKYLTCNECLGDGKYDWIEQATGKPKTTTMDGSGSYTSTASR